nr:MAG TPA: hypothetical protein [Bacteriophage sp.]
MYFHHHQNYLIQNQHQMNQIMHKKALLHLLLTIGFSKFHHLM